MATKNMSLDEYKKTRIRSISLLSGSIWIVGQDGVESIQEVFHKPVPMYYIEQNDVWFEIPVTSVEFVSGYLK